MINMLNLSLVIFFSLSLHNQQDKKILFNGISLDGWQVIDAIGHGNISVADSCIIIGRGQEITGIKWTRDFPVNNYEVSIEAKRLEGRDFFCSITFPVNESFLTLVIGGWGGSVTGLSSLDGYDASENETYGMWEFTQDQWYTIQLMVTDRKIEAWVGTHKIVDYIYGNTDLSLRWEVESSSPFGITTYKTTSAVRNIRMNTLPEAINN